MTTYFEQECPLCDIPGEYCKVDARNVKYFKCGDCGMFQISRSAEKLLHSEYSNRKADYSAQVKKTPEDHLFFIRLRSHEFRQASDDKFQAEYTLKSALSLS